MTQQHVYRFISLNIWGNLPSRLQRAISRIYANIYNRSFTRFIIKPYCRFNYSDPSYLKQFRSSTGSDQYQSFQDFFTRVYKKAPLVTSSYVWPCEGLLCEYGTVGQLKEVNVKGDLRNVRVIFGDVGKEIPDDYYFSNVFLHNNNYHRIHAPVSGHIKAIEHIPGDLVLLRPWIYKKDPSLPAMRNERMNIVIEDELGRPWYLSIVGGPAVGSIVLTAGLSVGSEVNIIDEVGMFLLGSTCCMASPIEAATPASSSVFVGDNY